MAWCTIGLGDPRDGVSNASDQPIDIGGLAARIDQPNPPTVGEVGQLNRLSIKTVETCRSHGADRSNPVLIARLRRPQKRCPPHRDVQIRIARDKQVIRMELAQIALYDEHMARLIHHRDLSRVLRSMVPHSKGDALTRPCF
ncbi:MAG TPA: hypothetical protein VFP34_00105 [Microlunatus sp.]|nr:hypothetical protein [Microlunatus sp.]